MGLALTRGKLEDENYTQTKGPTHHHQTQADTLGHTAYFAKDALYNFLPLIPVTTRNALTFYSSSGVLH